MAEHCSNPACFREATGRSIIDQKPYCGKYCQPCSLIGYRNPETDTLHCDSPGCRNEVIGQIGLSDYCLEHLTEEAARRKRQREVSPDCRPSPPAATTATATAGQVDVEIEARKRATEAVLESDREFNAREAILWGQEYRDIMAAAEISTKDYEKVARRIKKRQDKRREEQKRKALKLYEEVYRAAGGKQEVKSVQ